MTDAAPPARRRMALIAAGLVAAAGLAGAGAVAFDEGPDAPDASRGAKVYADACAACHGARLEGAPDWRRPGPDGRLPAPPHDASGHTWHHADALLFAIVKHGSAAVVGGGYESDMPGFADLLSDAEIRDVLAYIRSQWPERERAHQAEITRRAEAGG